MHNAAQLTLWDIGLDEWTDELRSEACRIMDEWIAAHGGRV